MIARAKTVSDVRDSLPALRDVLAELVRRDESHSQRLEHAIAFFVEPDMYVPGTSPKYGRLYDWAKRPPGVELLAQHDDARRLAKRSVTPDRAQAQAHAQRRDALAAQLVDEFNACAGEVDEVLAKALNDERLAAQREQYRDLVPQPPAQQQPRPVRPVGKW